MKQLAESLLSNRANEVLDQLESDWPDDTFVGDNVTKKIATRVNFTK